MQWIVYIHYSLETHDQQFKPGVCHHDVTRGEGGGLLGICGGGVPPSSPNPDPISDQNMPFSIPIFRPDIYVYKGLNYVTIA